MGADGSINLSEEREEKMDEQMFRAVFRMDLFEKVENKVWGGVHADPYIWVAFILHKRIQRLEKLIPELNSAEPLQLPDVDEAGELLKDFWTLWQGERIFDVEATPPISDDIKELIEEFRPFFRMLKLHSTQRLMQRYPSS